MYIEGKTARIGLFGGSALIAMAFASQASAQEAEATYGVADIVVTAQKREQSLQDVPLAITAISANALQTNRIQTLMDLGAQAPNLNIRATAGGNLAPTYTMRGSVTYGTVAGQDKTISVYLDGVYMGAPYGSAFDLPDLERIEVLRGPQGTLFGRNSTAGAISIVTREPSGELGLRQQFTYGNFDQLRSSTRVELPQIGPFSASISYTHDERNGDVKNLGAGTVWNYSNANPDSWIHKINTVSPKRLGNKNSESIFAAVKFEPSDSFKMVYKFDWNENHGSPEANQLVAIIPAFLGGFGNVIQAVLNSAPLVPAGQHRPDEARNGFTIPSYIRTQGHNLTASYVISDQLSIKNILAFRKNGTVVASSVGGYDAKITKPAADALAAFQGFPPGSFDILIGANFTTFGAANETHSKQWSDEVQLNYDSDLLTLTVGGIYYDIEAEVGTIDGLQNGYFTAIVPGGLLGGGQRNRSYFKGKSMAGYAQAEVHVTPQLDVIGGYRLTRDKKDTTTFIWATTVAPARQTVRNARYRDTRSSYMLGVNYKPSDAILLYGKYSTGYVSGGSLSGYDYEPETVKAWEAGVKADLLDRKLRANLALFKADYKNIQSVSGGRFLPIPDPDAGTLVLREGDLDTKGFELELTAAPTRGLTLTGAVGYTDVKLKNPNLLLIVAGSRVTVRPRWTSNLSAQYDTPPMFGDAYMMFRVDGSWRSRSLQLGRPAYPAAWDPVIYSKAMWLVNARVALRDIAVAGAKAELALWGRNLTDSDNPGQPIDFQFAVTSTYTPARTYGVDLTFEF
ncbi:MAG TPA: TonB-dependent receptor [Novosphingobium sp.]|nr:TonB-dependent receptor [Novosphingobium sp.]